jgi:hypothetical protein
LKKRGQTEITVDLDFIERELGIYLNNTCFKIPSSPSRAFPSQQTLFFWMRLHINSGYTDQGDRWQVLDTRLVGDDEHKVQWKKVRKIYK